MLRNQLPFGWLFGGSMLVCRRDRFIQFESRHLVQKVIIMSNVSFGTSLCLFSSSHVLWCHLSMIYQCLSLTNIKIYVMPENGLECSMAILERIMIRMINQWMGCSFPKMFSQTQPEFITCRRCDWPARGQLHSKGSGSCGNGDSRWHINIPSGNLLHSYWKWPFIVGFPIKNCDFP